MTKKLRDRLIKKFKVEVNDVVETYEDKENGKAVDLLNETDFHALTIGWGMAQGLNPSDAFGLATFIRYNTPYG